MATNGFCTRKFTHYFPFANPKPLIYALILIVFSSAAVGQASAKKKHDKAHRPEKVEYNPKLKDGPEQRKLYIKKFKDAAIANRKKYGIPVAITLGQGILESGGGTSYLAQVGNNHFGIKSNSEWHGRTLCKPGEDDPYRKYASVEECYEDHAKFLKRKRYAPLFKLKITDYKGWARKIQECGYATDPRYAEKLIGVIEKYKLYEFDK